jgi:putative pyruvate formate lyase activating enzyme
MASFEPAYMATYENGKLREKIKKAHQLLSPCSLCPRKCRVDRLGGETGVCRTAAQAWVSSYNPHFGEESPLVGTYGSGTIFFTHCNLMCLFCQNFDISHQGHGQAVSDEQLAAIMLALQHQGCHNINFVTPSHVVPQILAALEIAVQRGLDVPLVYNSGGYDRPATLRLLEGVFDIYMPDFKFWNREIAESACQAGNYADIACRALKEMHRQVGDLVTDDAGIAQHGLIIRHLVLPGSVAGTREIMRFIAREISTGSYVNIMPQYRPCGRAGEIKELNTFLLPADYRKALQEATEEGITRLDQPRRYFVLK